MIVEVVVNDEPPLSPTPLQPFLSHYQTNTHSIEKCQLTSSFPPLLYLTQIIIFPFLNIKKNKNKDKDY